MRRAVTLLGGQSDLGETLGYQIKRRLLGPPMVNEQLSEERLSKPVALGVLSPDGISSSAYGTEEILIELLRGGLAITAFTLILPLTGVVLFVMALVVLSYREVVTVYTRAGGSYVVARENFGPKVAQVAAVALLIDYVVTVAVQVAAGTAAVASAYHPIDSPTVITVISIAIVILMCYGNLRGIREAGRSFAVPTYLFSAVVIIMIAIGLLREALGTLPQYHYPLPGQWTAAHSHSSLISFGLMFVLLRAFANGGSSLTGIEAVSNAVSAFRPPEGINARRVLVIEGVILGTLVAGISWLAHVTHAAPYKDGVPTVISQEAKIVFGSSLAGHWAWILVQAATALILYTGGNTSFNGFPFLASFVAEDAFLPRWLTKRGHRLVFSNGIIVLAVLSCILLAVAGANVNNLVPFYALGVFTAFTMAGFGMAKYHHRMQEPGWRRKFVINFSAGVTSLIVVLIFAVVKFKEGAWLVLIVFAIMVPVLIRLNREYRMEARVLEGIGTRRQLPAPPTYPRRTVFLFVDSFDLATLAALRYARSLRPTTLRAVHFVIDSAEAANLREEWLRANTSVVLDFIDCPDRRLTRAAAELVNAEAALPGVGVTAILPRRGYSPLLGRLLHDRTADKIAGVVSRIPHAAATIVPFDVRSRLESLHGRPGGPGDHPLKAVPTDEAAPFGPADAKKVPKPAGQAQVPKPAGQAQVPKPAGQAQVPRPADEITSAGQAVDPSAPAPVSKPAKPSAAREATEPKAVSEVRGPEPVSGAQQPVPPGDAAEPAAPAGEATEPTSASAGQQPEPVSGATEPAVETATEQQAGEDAIVAMEEVGGTIAASGGASTAKAGSQAAAAAGREAAADGGAYERPVPPAGVRAMASLDAPGRATVEGRVYAVEIRPVEQNTVLAAELADSTGQLTALFYGRSHIPGMDCGARVRLRGQVGIRDGGPVMINPAYELLGQGQDQPQPPPGEDPPGGKEPRRGKRS